MSRNPGYEIAVETTPGENLIRIESPPYRYRPPFNIKLSGKRMRYQVAAIRIIAGIKGKA
jgi:hypothetical protein